nr:hypothetical protein [Amantichitinum ursilacus]
MALANALETGPRLNKPAAPVAPAAVRKCLLEIVMLCALYVKKDLNIRARPHKSIDVAQVG